MTKTQKRNGYHCYVYATGKRGRDRKIKNHYVNLIDGSFLLDYAKKEEMKEKALLVLKKEFKEVSKARLIIKECEFEDVEHDDGTKYTMMSMMLFQENEIVIGLVGVSMKAQVKWFNEKKGYGFLIGPDGRDLFVHYSAIKTNGFQTLMDGAFVDCDVEETPKGPFARNVIPSIKCDGKIDCRESATWIDHRGFAYCEFHGKQRAASEPCRAMSKEEIDKLKQGILVRKF